MLGFIDPLEKSNSSQHQHHFLKWTFIHKTRNLNFSMSCFTNGIKATLSKNEEKISLLTDLEKSA